MDHREDPLKSETDVVDVSRTIIFSDDLKAMTKGAVKIFAIYGIIFLGSFWLYSRLNTLEKSVLIFNIIFFTFIATSYIYRFYLQKRIIILSPDGLLDSNTLTEIMPWSSVSEFSPVHLFFHGKDTPLTVRLKLKPGTRRNLKLNWRAKHLSPNKDELNIAFGQGLISPGLHPDIDRFSEIIGAYVRTYGDNSR